VACGLVFTPAYWTLMKTSFLAFLRAELARRCARNESYSLRAFARQLGVDHATLSQILRGRRELTPEMIERLGRELDVSDTLRKAFVDEARSASGRASEVVAEAAAILVDPIHEAILACVAQEDFTPDVRVLARILDTDADSVNVAVQRLAHAGLLVMESSTRWTSRLDTNGTTFDLALWDHVSRRLAEAPTAHRAADEPTPRANPVRQFQLLARDPAALAEFYSGAFGWKVTDANALGYRQISTGASGLEGGIWPAPPQATPFVQLFVEVDDLEVTLARATSLGAKVLLPPQVLPDGDAMALLVDPQGIPLGIFKPSKSRL